MIKNIILCDRCKGQNLEEIENETFGKLIRCKDCDWKMRAYNMHDITCYNCGQKFKSILSFRYGLEIECPFCEQTIDLNTASISTMLKMENTTS